MCCLCFGFKAMMISSSVMFLGTSCGCVWCKLSVVCFCVCTLDGAGWVAGVRKDEPFEDYETKRERESDDSYENSVSRNTVHLRFCLFVFCLAPVYIISFANFVCF